MRISIVAPSPYVITEPEDGRLPYHITVPLVVGVSVGLWVGIWKASVWAVHVGLALLG